MESFNKNLHPFSIFYRRVPDFRRLAKKYGKLDELMDDGKLNFKKRKVCFVVCQVLLAEYFSVGYWKIPKKYLIPAIPQRMNYLCWIKEIMNIDNLTVLDIGTGANVIFPLLGARSFKWKFIATEKHSKSVKIAKKIIERNELQEQVKVMKVRNGILQEICEEFQVSICNPPFFDRSQGEKDAFGGVDEELCTSGGELKFIKDYIIESWSKRSGRTFTSLIGVKSHLTTLITFLETNFPRVSLQQTTFFQGRTIRWGLAWTFNNCLN